MRVNNQSWWKSEQVTDFGRVMIIAVASVLLLALSAQAQERTLLNAQEIESGGFGGPQVMLTTFRGDPGVLAGGSGAWVINQSFYLGGGGFGLVTNHEGPDVTVGAEGEEESVESRLALGYGGVLIGIIVLNDELLHLTGDVMIGGGALGRMMESETHTWEEHGAEGFWIVQPMVHLELNVTEWMRANLSGGYRIVRDLNSYGVTGEDASGPLIGLSFRFGSW